MRASFQLCQTTSTGPRGGIRARELSTELWGGGKLGFTHTTARCSLPGTREDPNPDGLKPAEHSVGGGDPSKAPNVKGSPRISHKGMQEQTLFTCPKGYRASPGVKASSLTTSKALSPAALNQLEPEGQILPEQPPPRTGAS